MKFFLPALVGLIIFTNSYGQSKKILLAGPMLGHTDLRTAAVWVQMQEGITSATAYYRQKNTAGTLRSVPIKLKGGEFNTAVFTLSALEPGLTYTYYIAAGQGKKFLDSGTVTTQSLWQYRKPPPDFSFLAGSCAYFNEPQYDRPGEPYGKDSSIFLTMAKEKSDLMLWLGDNWYTRGVDYNSEWGLYYRASRDRGLPVLKNFLKSMSHYAIWDDHDYGPNDADKSYHLKESARSVFTDYWANPSYGFNNEGIFTRFNFNDVDFFMLDARWNRSNDQMKDSVNGAPNKEKKMFGDVQMDWLKNSLLFSNGMSAIKFRVIVTGSQVLNEFSPWDAFKSFPAEFNELLSFLEENKIRGVIFITGDRHHSEIIKLDRKNGYPLYDVTVSPLTSSPAKTSGAEINNPQRVGKEIDEQNYGRFSVSGEGKERKLTVEMVSKEGKTLDTWSVKATDLVN